MRIYVGNLGAETSSKDLRALFGPHGDVKRALLAKDRETGERRGYAIVEMDDAGARAAIAALRGVSEGGRLLKVRRAKPRPPGPETGRAPVEGGRN